MKKWYYSKVLWTNILVLTGIILQMSTGKEILPAEAQVAILSVVNIVLRAITKEGLN